MTDGVDVDATAGAGVVAAGRQARRARENVLNTEATGIMSCYCGDWRRRRIFAFVAVMGGGDLCCGDDCQHSKMDDERCWGWVNVDPCRVEKHRRKAAVEVDATLQTCHERRDDDGVEVVQEIHLRMMVVQDADGDGGDDNGQTTIRRVQEYSHGGVEVGERRIKHESSVSTCCQENQFSSHGQQLCRKDDGDGEES